MLKRLHSINLLMAITASGSFVFNVAAYGGQTEIKAPAKSDTSASSVPLAGASEGNIYADLGRLRDWGLNIRQIKQQALSLYLEATRTEPSPNDGPDLNVPTEIPKSENLDCSKCLPPRPEWIAYYLNSMEPLAQFIHVKLKASEAGKISVFVPKGTTAELKPLRADIHGILRKLESDLDSLNEFLNAESISNEQLVKVSREIYDDAGSYEDLRKRFYEVIRNARKQGVTTFEVLPPISQK